MFPKALMLLFWFGSRLPVGEHGCLRGSLLLLAVECVPWFDFCVRRDHQRLKLSGVVPSYGPTVINEGKVRQWCWGFKNDRTDVCDEEQRCRPSTQAEEIAQQVDQALQTDWWLKISALADKFILVGHTAVYRIVTERLEYHKLRAK